IGTGQGYLAVSCKSARDGGWREEFYNWREDQSEITAWLGRSVVLGDVYFCPTLLRHPKRVKQNVEYSLVAWADLDECPADKLLVEPTALVQTSQGRLHAYWMLNALTPAEEVEYVNKRIAYAHADDGCDKTGWDLTQYLRIPSSHNYKDPFNIQPVKMLHYRPSLLYSISDFDVYPHVEHSEIASVPIPSQEEVNEVDVEELLVRIKGSVNPRVWPLLEREPSEDATEGWSGNLWQLEKLLFTAGLDRLQVFAIVRKAACNKYARDGKSESLLWADILRAENYAEKEDRSHFVDNDRVEDAWYVPKIDILTEEERKRAEQTPSVIEDRSEEHTSELQSPCNLVCRLLLEKKKKN